MADPIFKKLILIGRPASGKSEFIDFLKKTPEEKRRQRYHIGGLQELDDFVWLWQKFVEDDLWEKAGQRRLFSKKMDHAYCISDGTVLDYCLARFNEEIKKVPADAAAEKTVFIEFARGAGDGGYRYALSRLSDEILRDAAVLFIYTSYEEALRRNEARYIEKLKHSVLAHKVPAEDMERFAKEIDWGGLTEGKPFGHLVLRHGRIPFLTMNNEPELKEDSALEERYKAALDQLMELYQQKERI